MLSDGKDDKQSKVIPANNNKEIVSRLNSEIVLNNILDYFPDIIYMLDLNFVCTYVNRKGLSFLDKTIDEVLGKRILELFPPEIASENMLNIQVVTETGDSKTFNNRFFPTPKGIICLDTIIIAIKDSNGKVTGILGYSRDMTDRKKEEEVMLKQEINDQKIQKLESLGILAGGIAHDFNNLLGGLFGYIEKARSHSSEKDKVEDNLAKAIAVFEKAKTLTNQLLTFSKGGSPNTKTVDIKEMLEKNVKFLTNGANIKVVFDISEDLKCCDVDENQISQVIDNLVMNARQAMSKGGTLKVTAHNINKNNVESSLLEKVKEYVEIIISDTGSGIPPEVLPKIFDPFFSTKKHGSGLGLATSFSIVKRHKGAIEAVSSISQGTSIHVYLPSSEKKVDNCIEKPVVKVPVTGNILVMDDEVFILELLKDILQELGYNVNTVEKSDDALEIFKNALPSRNRYDIVILDLTIPGGMGGKEIVKRMKEFDPKVKAIASSGYSDDEIMSRPKEFGFDASLAKPYAIEALSKILQELSSK
ncbi:MAG: hypothetical protein A2231_12215 [Candidatus Firestonebacteria bacterium RIFOXYA2_FULL_40_8]|nr:MAG: hypothetical protein A2231_12215 [Candidatus Firestonebacteria bacterium RIFOXYA2_FULL_40_8]